MTLASNLCDAVRRCQSFEATVLQTERLLDGLPLSVCVRHRLAMDEQCLKPRLRLGLIWVAPVGVIALTPSAVASGVRSLSEALRWCSEMPPTVQAPPTCAQGDLSAFYLTELLQCLKDTIPAAAAVLFNITVAEAKKIADIAVDRFTVPTFLHHFGIDFVMRGAPSAILDVRRNPVDGFLTEFYAPEKQMFVRARTLLTKLRPLLFPAPPKPWPPLFEHVDGKTLEALAELLAELDVTIPSAGRLLMLARQWSASKAQAAVRRAKYRLVLEHSPMWATRGSLRRMAAVTRSITAGALGEEYDGADVIVVFITAALLAVQYDGQSLSKAGHWISLIEKRIKLFLDELAPTPGMFMRREAVLSPHKSHAESGPSKTDHEKRLRRESRSPVLQD